MPPAAPRPSRQRGSILVESLVALLLLSVALLMGLPLLFSQPGVVRRLDAQRVELSALDSTLEALRTGALDSTLEVLPTGALPLQSTLSGAGTPDDPAIWVEIEPRTPAGLYRVTLRAAASGRQIETLVWRP